MGFTPPEARVQAPPPRAHVVASIHFGRGSESSIECTCGAHTDGSQAAVAEWYRQHVLRANSASGPAGHAHLPAGDRVEA